MFSIRKIRMKTLLHHRASWAVYDQVLVSGANFLSTLIIARMLAPEVFGMFSLASLAILFLASFHRTLITQPMNALGSTESFNKLAWRYAGLMRMQLPMISISILILACIGLVFFPDLGLIIGASSYLAGFFLQEMVRRYHYTKGDIQRALINDLISYGGQIIVLASLYATGFADAAFAFIALAVTSLTAFLYGQRDIRNHQALMLAPVVSVPSGNLLEEHWKFAKWIVLSQFVFWGATQVYPFILANQNSYAEVADFNVANSILNALNIIRLMLGNYLPARVSVVYASGGTAALRRLLLRTLILAGGVSLIVILVLMLSANWLVDILFAGKYPLAGQLVGWLAFAYVASIISVVTNAGALPLKATNWIFYANGVGTMFSLGFGPFLVARFGVWGAIAGLCVASFLPALIQGVHVFYKCRPINDTKQS